jgi:ribosomal protein L34E
LVPPLGETFSGLWSKVAMHLWREHRIDMELMTCDKCPEFRAFNRARLEDHMTKHKTERPFKCLECESCFKHERHLKDHMVRGHGKEREYKKPAKVSAHKCRICDRVFKVILLVRPRTYPFFEDMLSYPIREFDQLDPYVARAGFAPALEVTGWRTYHTILKLTNHALFKKW